MSERVPQGHNSQTTSTGPRQGSGSARSPRNTGTAQRVEQPGLQKQWQAMEREGGLYTVAQIAQHLGFGGGPNAKARQLTGKGRILVVKRGGAFLYPGFQFDWSGGRVLPTVKEVVRMGRYAGWPDERIAVWFYTPHPRLANKRPVDVRDNEEELMGLADEEIGR